MTFKIDITATKLLAYLIFLISAGLSLYLKETSVIIAGIGGATTLGSIKAYVEKSKYE